MCCPNNDGWVRSCALSSAAIGSKRTLCNTSYACNSFAHVGGSLRRKGCASAEHSREAAPPTSARQGALESSSLELPPLGPIQADHISKVHLGLKYSWLHDIRADRFALTSPTSLLSARPSSRHGDVTRGGGRVCGGQASQTSRCRLALSVITYQIQHRKAGLEACMVPDVLTTDMRCRVPCARSGWQLNRFDADKHLGRGEIRASSNLVGIEPYVWTY